MALKIMINKAVIFDMDGVLVNSEPHHFKVEKILFEKENIVISEEEVHSFVGLAMDKMWGKIKEKHSLLTSLDKLLEQDTAFRVNYFKNLENFEPVKGVKPLVSGIISKNFKTAVASSSHSDLINTILEISDLKQYFPLLVSGFDVPSGKPEPDIFLKTAEKLGVNPRNCVVIEDSCNGVTAAVKAGMKCIGFKNISSGNQDLTGADLIIDDLSKLTVETISRLLPDKP